MNESSLTLDTLIDALAKLAAADYLREHAAPEHDLDDERAERVPLQAAGRGA